MAFRLNKQQRISAVKHYYMSNNNAAEASRRLSAEYKIVNVQGRNIKSLVAKFELTGSVADAAKSGRPRTVSTEEMSNAICDSLTQSPQKSTRRLSAEFGISHVTVYKLLKERNMKPYIPRLIHALNDGDSDKRLEFSELFLEKVEHDEAFVDQIWWSDEACFKLNGQINRHNCVYWSSENPRVLVEKAVNLPGITVWAAISSLGIIGPYFFEGTVTADAYLTMLQTFFWPRAQNHQDFYFQQDGAPPHYGLKVREWLDTNFEGKWIGRRGPIEWPARSPDLTPPDFFLWGVIKNLVYAQKPATLEDLRGAIVQSFNTIDVELFQKVCRSVAERFQKCAQHNGEHFEHFD